MKWNNEAIKENIKIWAREQNNPEALWEIEYGVLAWHGMLNMAVKLAQKTNTPLPPIYFPSPRQCEQFIAFCKKSQTIKLCKNCGKMKRPKKRVLK